MYGGDSSGAGGSGGGRGNNEALARLTHMMMSVPPPQPVIVVGGVGDTEEFSRRDDRVPMWSQQETRDFIAIRGQLERDFTVAKRNKSLWEVVAARMKELGYRRTPDQCKCKWKNLVSRYKGKETSDRDNTRTFPFFDDLHAIFIERATNTQQTPFDPEASSSLSKSKKRDSYQSLEEISEDEEEDNKILKTTIPPRKKLDRGKQPQTSNPEKHNSVHEILHDFFQQQQMIDMQWRELMEKHANERQMFEQEWRQSMERMEMERMRTEQSWREKEEQRKIREEGRAERRDALLTLLLNKLVHDQ
ncbi:hypothetical protein L1987_55984 [Smallanthus sonchifolius]|uniref:Uncharacterized protein n=1 Tax=Smallanthus sonchifolius TaxID=185202 RepID=A0ACB9EC47_9ASTR|nr:hypothetical protein L1987_55984 [Smallanthus sonchifolius]